MNKVIKSIIGWILYVAVLVGLIFGIPRGLTYLLKTEHPMASITSGSMWPSLKKGDLIFIKGLAGKTELQMGDIIVFRNQKGLTVHRIVKFNEETLVTKGDANNVEDSPVEYEEIIGKVVFMGEKPLRVPLLGMISVYLNKNNL